MRTTVNLAPEVLKQLKERAISSGRSIGGLIEDDVRLAAARRQEQRDPVEPLPTYGGSGTLPGIDLASSMSLYEAMDEGAPVDALR